jgi:hypothetical protein
VPKLIAGYSVLPVRSMSKVAEGFHWKIASQGPDGQFDILYFEHRTEAEEMCRELNGLDAASLELFSGAA